MIAFWAELLFFLIFFDNSVQYETILKTILFAKKIEMLKSFVLESRL